jgi:hypothetical protein
MPSDNILCITQDKTLLEDPLFQAFWERNVAESVRQADAWPFVEEAVLQVSDWGFSLSDIQTQKKEDGGFFDLIKSMFNQVEREWVGFLGPIHVWQVCTLFAENIESFRIYLTFSWQQLVRTKETFPFQLSKYS